MMLAISDPFLKTRDSAKLDLVRTIAVSFVVTSHLPPVDDFVVKLLGPDRYHLQALGLFGVAMFFVHTCLVLMYSLERLTHRGGMQAASKAFLIRRAFRIYPLSIVVVLVLAVMTGINPQTEISWSALASNLLLIQNVSGHDSTPAALWSLPYEIQMYFLLPLLFFMVHQTGTPQKAARLVLVIWVASVSLTLLVWWLGFSYHLIKYLPMFLPGLLAFALTTNTGRERPHVGWLFVYVAMTSFMFPWLVALGCSETVMLWAICLGLGLMIPFTREMSNGPLRRIAAVVAKYSYGIYLVHGPMIDYAFGPNVESPAGRWLVFVGGTALLAIIGFHAIERPGITAGIRLASRINRRRSCSAGSESIT